MDVDSSPSVTLTSTVTNLKKCGLSETKPVFPQISQVTSTISANAAVTIGSGSGSGSGSSTGDNGVETIDVGEFTVNMGTMQAVDNRTQQRYSCRAYPHDYRDRLLATHSRLDVSRHVSRLHTLRTVRGNHGDRLFAFYQPSFGNFYTWLRQHGALDEATAATFFYQVLQAVLDAHQAGVVVRELRLRNLVFSNPECTEIRIESLAESVCLQDPLDDNVYHTKQCCPSYISPEMLNGAKSNSRYPGRASDCWSLGIVLHALLVGHYPFCEKDFVTLFQRIRNAYFNVPMHVSPIARSLIRSLLRRDPNERLTVSQVLSHPWITHRSILQSSSVNSLLSHKKKAGNNSVTMATRGLDGSFVAVLSLSQHLDHADGNHVSGAQNTTFTQVNN